MFTYNMFIRPSEDELEDFDPEWAVINAPGFMADPDRDSTRQHNFSILNFTKKLLSLEGLDTREKLKKSFFLP